MQDEMLVTPDLPMISDHHGGERQMDANHAKRLLDEAGIGPMATLIDITIRLLYRIDELERRLENVRLTV